jgi:hypothetical protein
MRKRYAALAGAAALVGAWALYAAAADAPAPDVPQVIPTAEEATPPAAAAEVAGPMTAPPPVQLDYGVPLPPAFYEKLPPNSRLPLTLPPGIRSGLRCPDGTFLPLLNGVPEAYPLKRAARFGPMPPVVAKVTDSGGYEWYEHADGSLTTTRWTPSEYMGKPGMTVVTSHNVPQDPRTTGRSKPNTPVEPAGGSETPPPSGPPPPSEPPPSSSPTGQAPGGSSP